MNERSRGHAASAKALRNRNLLTTRVLSVDTYWQELRDPNRCTSWEIPVPLWSGESPQEYEREFKSWLTMRRLSLATMRGNPMRERKFRLQFAHTRGIGMSRSASHRAATPYQSSRSRSRPWSRRRYVCDGNPSLGNGRSVSGSSAADQSLLNVAQSHSPPPLRNVSHRSNVEPWVRSRSNSPHLFTCRAAASPQHSEKSVSSFARRSASPCGQNPSETKSLSRQLLARRVISVEAFRDEMSKLHNGLIREDDLKRPHEAMVRIPIVLLRCETIPQYTLEFRWWLQSRDISLASLRDDPAKERSLWYAFACTRAEVSDTVDPARPVSNPSRSRFRSSSPSRSNRRSSGRGHPLLPLYGETKPLQRVYPRERSDYTERRRSTSPPLEILPSEDERLVQDIPRQLLLERRTFTIEQYKTFLERNDTNNPSTSWDSNQIESIPVPLFPGEKMGLYDHRFWLWLEKYNESKASIKSSPMRERRFRIAFAKRRVREMAAATQEAQDPILNLESGTNISVGDLTSPRPRPAVKMKRFEKNDEWQASTCSEESSSKRVRIASKENTCTYEDPGFKASPLFLDSKLERDLTLLSGSDQSLPHSGSQAATSAFLTQIPTSTTTSTSTTPIATGLSSQASTAATAHSVQLAVAPLTKETLGSSPVRSVSRSASSNAHLANSLTASSKSQSGSDSTEPAICKSTSLASVDSHSLKYGSSFTFDSSWKSQERSHRLPQLTGVQVSTTQKSLPSSSTFLAASADLTASKAPASDRSHSIPAVAIDAAKPEWTNSTVAFWQTLQRSSSSVNGIDNASVHVAADTSSAVHKVTDAKSILVNDFEEHDGDLLNPEGCCCTKCMQNWAKTLTDRLNRLERNVGDLKQVSRSKLLTISSSRVAL